MKSFIYTLALASSVIHFSEAHIAARHEEVESVDTTSVLDYIRNFFLQRHQHDKRQDSQICAEDAYYSILANYSSATPFCSEFISIPLSTVTVEVTPTT